MSEVLRFAVDIQGREMVDCVRAENYDAALAREARLEASYQTMHEVVARVTAERNALQLLLNTADQRNADLEAAILKAKAWSDGEAHERLDEILDAVIGQSAIVTEQVQP